MQCDKCGHTNSIYSVVCEQCGAPLNIENNTFLQEKYHDKGTHIDIEEIEKTDQEPDFNETKKKVSKAVIVFAILIIASFLFFLMDYFTNRNSQEVWNQYKDYMKNSSLALLYLGNDKDLDDICKEFSSAYEFDYLNIDAKKITRGKKKKIREELNIYNVTSTMVVIQSGVPTATLSNVKEEEALIEFLKEQELIPEQLEDVNPILENYRNAFASEKKTILYLPTSSHEKIEENSETLYSIALEYSYDYYEVKGYLLSRKQLLRMMSQLGYSEIQDDLIVSLVDGKVDKVIVDTEKNSDSYFQLLSSYGIIDSTSTEFLLPISYEEWDSMVSNGTNKSVVLIGSENCSSCDSMKVILGLLSNRYQLDIYYLDATNTKDQVSEKIRQMGIETGLSTTPFLMISEKGSILDTIIGVSTRELYIEKLTELGVIR